MRIGTMEVLLIIVLALVIFGGGKLAGVGKALGQSIKDFRTAVKDDPEEAKKKEPEEEENQAKAE